MSDDQHRLHLITLGPSHYCEKARWALQRCTVNFKETAHYPGFHLLFIKKLGGGTSLPKLRVVGADGGGEQILHDSSDILAFTDSFIPTEDGQLYPADIKESVQAWENEFDEVLGPHIRRWAYCHLLYHKGIYTLLSQRASLLEKIAGFLLLPVIRGRIHKLVGCHTPNAKERSLDMIVKIFDKVNAALADGRPYICGERFSAADLTFAALAGPAILPARYGAKLPKIEDIPREMAENVSYLRETAAGKHILRLYDADRYKSAT